MSGHAPVTPQSQYCEFDGSLAGFQGFGSALAGRAALESSSTAAKSVGKSVGRMDLMIDLLSEPRVRRDLLGLGARAHAPPPAATAVAPCGCDRARQKTLSRIGEAC